MSAPARRLRRAPSVLSVLVVLVLFAGCTDSGEVVADGSQDKDEEATPLQPRPTTPSTEALASVAGMPCVAAKDIPPAEGKTEPKMPEGPPPTELVTEDLVVGEGPEATDGKVIRVHYTGVSCSTGEQFDSSWDSGEPFELTLGEGGVIPGWDQGIVGMKEGGRRQLVIPPDLAYGSDGRPGIAPDETLVFVVDLLEVK